MISRDQKIGISCLLAGVGLFSTVEIAGKMIGGRVDPVDTIELVAEHQGVIKSQRHSGISTVRPS